MTADRHLTRIVRSWLRSDEHESADRVLETVLARLEATPQRRPWGPTRRFPRMNTLTRLSLAAVLVVALAAAGYALLPRTGGIGGPQGSIPTATPRPTYPLLNGQSNLNGRFTVGGGLKSRVTVQAPAGWSAGTDWVVRGPSGYAPPAGMAVRFYTPTTVFKNPRDISQGVFDSIGPSAADLATAILGDPAWGARQAPDVAIDGRPAKHLQFEVPSSSGLGADGQFDMFGDAHGVEEYGIALGQIFDLYIVDVGSERVVIDAFHFPGTSKADLAAQQAVISSIQLDPGP